MFVNGSMTDLQNDELNGFFSKVKKKLKKLAKAPIKHTQRNIKSAKQTAKALSKGDFKSTVKFVKEDVKAAVGHAKEQQETARLLHRDIRQATGVYQIEDKLGLRKLGRKLDKAGIPQMAAMAVLTVVTGGAAIGFVSILKEAAIQLAKNIVKDQLMKKLKAKLMEKLEDKQRKEVEKEIAALEKELTAEQLKQAQTLAPQLEADAIKMAQANAELLTPEQKTYIQTAYQTKGDAALDDPKVIEILKLVTVATGGDIANKVVPGSTAAGQAATAEAYNRGDMPEWFLPVGAGALILFLIMRSR